MSNEETYPVNIDGPRSKRNQAEMRASRLVRNGGKTVKASYVKNYEIRIRGIGNKGQNDFRVVVELAKVREAIGGDYKRAGVPRRLKDVILRSFTLPKMENLDEKTCQDAVESLKADFEEKIESEYLPEFKRSSKVRKIIESLKNPVPAVVDEPKKIAFLVVECGVLTLFFNKKAGEKYGMELLNIPCTQGNMKKLGWSLRKAFEDRVGVNLDRTPVPRQLFSDASGTIFYGAKTRIDSAGSIEKIFNNTDVVRTTHGSVVANTTYIDETSRSAYIAITNPEPKK